MTQAYPLQWPDGRPRRAAAARKDAPFSKREWASAGKQSLTIPDAVRRLTDELRLLCAQYVVVSTNVEPRLDGFPRSERPKNDDPGVAIYFRLTGKDHCLPCDTFNSVAGNLAAVAAHIEATRKIERYGVASVAEQFAGFAALPAPEKPKPKWWEVLDVRQDAPVWMIEAAYKHHAKTAHPDAGGSADRMAALNAARDEALKERG